MVSTRRSSQKSGSEDESNVAALPSELTGTRRRTRSQQPAESDSQAPASTSSGLTSEKSPGGARHGRLAAEPIVLTPIGEQPEEGEPAHTPVRHTKAPAHSTQGHHTPVTTSKQPARTSTAGHPQGRGQVSKPALPTQDPWADISSSDFSDDEGTGLQGTGARAMMSNLAASISTAFQARASGSSQQPPNKPSSKQQQANKQQDADPDLQGAQLHWQPTIQPPKLKAPTRAVLQVEVQAEKDKALAKQLLVPSRDAKSLAKQQAAAKPDTAGKGWYDLPAQRIDDTMKRELRLLRLRHVYDPKRFYKTFDNTKFPKHFAMGTVVEGPADYYNGRLEASQRRKTALSEQLLADTSFNQVRKRRFNKLQAESSKYQHVKKRKTDQPKHKGSHHRPKH